MLPGKGGFTAPAWSVPKVDMWLQQTTDGTVNFATWFHGLGVLCVNVMFAELGERRQGLIDAWHPRFGSRLKIADFPGSDPRRKLSV